MPSGIKKGTEAARQSAWEGKHLRIVTCGRWEYAERTKATAGVVIVALTPEGELLLTEQHRVPVARNVIELPAGLAGDEQDSEEFLAAAQRELMEETGFEAAEWEQLASGPCTAGLSNEIVVFFHARDLRQVGDGGGCESEAITLHRIPLGQLRSWLLSKERAGSLIDPKIFAGLFLAGLRAG